MKILLKFEQKKAVAPLNRFYSKIYNETGHLTTADTNSECTDNLMSKNIAAMKIRLSRDCTKKTMKIRSSNSFCLIGWKIWWQRFSNAIPNTETQFGIHGSANAYMSPFQGSIFSNNQLFFLYNMQKFSLVLPKWVGKTFAGTGLTPFYSINIGISQWCAKQP